MYLRLLFLDFETASRVDLRKHGLDRYVNDPDFRVLLTAWGVDGSPIQLWQSHEGPMPRLLRECLEDLDTLIVAQNAQFERLTLRHALGYDIPARRFRCTMVMAFYVSLPGALEEIGKVLRLGDGFQKISEGAALLRRFCAPHKPTKVRPREWEDWSTDPEAWARFCAYCVRDAESCRKVYFTLKKFDLPVREWALWCLDQRINDHGIPVDLQFCRDALAMAAREKTEMLEEMCEITGLENPSSISQLLPWLRERGYPFSNLRKAQVKRGLEVVKGAAHRVLELRQLTSKTSIAKYQAILDRVGADGRLRYMFQFLGAARTGRWAGRAVQVHNLPRPANKDIEERYDLAQQLIRDNDCEGLRAAFGVVVNVLSSCIRSAFTAPPGRHFVVSDLSSIEDRKVGWLSGCERILEEHREGLDPYKAFARYLFGVGYDEVTPRQRQDAKPPKLGCAYGLGAGEEEIDKNGDVVKTGLLGYAESLGIPLTEEQCKEAVKTYRDTYSEVCAYWYDLESAAIQCIRTRRPQYVGKVVFDILEPCLRIRLPSGRHLHYVRPRVESKRFKRKKPKPGQDPYYTKTCVTYETQDQTTGRWTRIPTFGPRWLEQITQASSRDVLAEWMVRADAAGFCVVATVHDEIVGEEFVWKLSRTAESLSRLITSGLAWCSDMPLAAKGFSSPYYFKG